MYIFWGGAKVKKKKKKRQGRRELHNIYRLASHVCGSGSGSERVRGLAGWLIKSAASNCVSVESSIYITVRVFYIHNCLARWFGALPHKIPTRVKLDGATNCLILVSKGKSLPFYM